MSAKLTIGIVDYGVGNHASVRHCLLNLGLRCRVTDERAVLRDCDLLWLPGVGAFPVAMRALQAKGLDSFILEQAALTKPILGICLGMQLLTEASHEDGYTSGLGLIPGQILPLDSPRWHIGWNTVEPLGGERLFGFEGGQSFYFNHSYAYDGPADFHVCRTFSGRAFASVIRVGNVIGAQFHPEKSQASGRAFIQRVIGGLCGA